MPAGQIIGRVSVKVLPDTTDFRRRAQNDLDRIEQQLSVTVQSKIDVTGALRDALTEVRRINQENRTSDARKIRFATTIGTSGMDEEITKALRRLQDKADGRKLTIHTDLVGAVIATDLDEESLRHVEKQLKDWADDISPITVTVKPELVAGATTVINQRLRLLTRPRTVPILPNLDDGAVARVAAGLAALSGARVIASWFKDMADALERLDKSVPLIGSLALAVAGLAGWSLSAASNLFALSSSLAQIGPLALALPGIFGGFAIGVGATIAALKDFNTVLPEVKTQLGRVQDIISADFWKPALGPLKQMVDRLLPEFSTGMAGIAGQLGGFFAGLASGITDSLVGELAGMFADLSASIRIATGATGALATIIQTLGEVGAGNLPRLAQWFVDIAQRFSAWLTAAASDGRLQQWIDTALVQLAALGRAIVNLGSIFAGLGRAAEQAGGSTLTMLADTLGRIADAVNTPAFQQQLVSVLMAAHQAMNLIGTQSGPAITALFSALSATLATVLPMVGAVLGQLVAAIAQTLASPVFQTGLTAFFAGISSGAAALVPALAPVGAALAALGVTIGTFAAQLGPTIAQAFTLAAQAVQILAPALQQLMPPLAQLVQAFITALAPVVPQVASALAGLAPILGGLASFLAPLAPEILTVVAAWKTYTSLLAVQSWVTALAASNNAVAAWVGRQLLALGRLVASWASSAATAVASMVSYAASAVASAASSTAAWIAAQARTVASLAVTAAGFVAQGATMVASMAATAAKVVAGWVVMGAQSLLQAARVAAAWLIAMGPIAIITAAVIAIVALIIANWDTIKNATVKAWNAVMDGIGHAWDWITGKVDAAVNAVRAVISAVFAAVVTVITTYVTAWRTVITTVWTAIQTTVSTAVNAVRNVISTVFSAVRTFISAEVTGWKIIIQTVWTAIQTVVQGAVNNVRAAINGLAAIVNLIRGYFQQARDAVVDRVGALVATVKELPGRVRSALGNLGALLRSAGRQLIQGLIDGIKDMFGKVQSLLGSLTSKLPDWKGPAGRDRTLLVGAGRLVIDGFLAGMESRYAAVRASLGGLTTDISALATDAAGTTGLSARIAAALDPTGGTQVTKILNYYAAPGSSLNAEEDLFTAAGRARMVGW